MVARFLAFDDDLGLMDTLRALNAADKSVKGNKNTILVFSPTGELEIKSFRDATDALRALFDLESQFPDRDIVLVRADKSDEIRLAFRNYFSDATEFIRLVDDGCAKLYGAKRVPVGRALSRER